MGILLSGDPGQSGITTEHLVIFSNIALCGVTAFLALVSLVMAVVMIHQDHDMITAFRVIILALVGKKAITKADADAVTGIIGKDDASSE